MSDFKHLPTERIFALHASAIALGLAGKQKALFGGVALEFAVTIPDKPDGEPTERLLDTLHRLNAVKVLSDGSVPFEVWLGNAVRLTGNVELTTILAEIKAGRGGKAAADPRLVPRYRDDASRALAEELAKEQARKKALEKRRAPVEEVNQRILALKRALRDGLELRAGDMLGRFTLLERVGQGGFATVWRAVEDETEAVVAIKVLHPTLAGDPVRVDRFFRGARMMAELDHPAIVKVVSPKEEDEGVRFFVMEYVEGGDLQRAVAAGRVAREQVVPLIVAVGEGLGRAHERGLIHRDVKPANILMGSDGAPKLTDFDLVGAAETTGGTRTGALGTFVYAAPEAMEKPQEADARADVFGLAMTMVFALYGKALPPLAFRHPDTFVDQLACSLKDKRVLKKALDWDREQRYRDARALCEALMAPPGLWTEGGSDALGRYAILAVWGIQQKMRWIPPGTFVMGSPETEADRWNNEGPQHEVTLTEGYWLADTPCTQALWETVMGENPSRFRSADRPVENVSWDDCQAFLKKLEALVPGVRLPTEAEWEYACRAGTRASTWVGDVTPQGPYHAPELDAIAWYSGNSGVGFELDNGWDSSVWPEKQYPHTRAGTHPVGQKQPNPWGLYDMLGNVSEWCEDGLRAYTDHVATDSHGSGPYPVARGGSWLDHARFFRAASRFGRVRADRNHDLGFRIARGQTGQAGKPTTSWPAWLSPWTGAR